MAKGISMPLILGILIVVFVSPQPAGLAQQLVQSHVVPLKIFSKDQRFETVSGDPAKSGALYVIRIHAEAGYIIMPHVHPEDENIVVLKGSWAVGMGDRYNQQALEPMELGTYGLVQKKMAHFALSKTETILQVHGIGPFTTHWVAPMYELTDKGVLLETSAAEPGRPTPASPPGCFDLKLGARVRGGYGEGVVIAAQCTPGQLTQYRIEKPDGERFWAPRNELNTPKGTDMEPAQNVSIPEMTEAISARLVAQWEGWKNQDTAPNDAIIADDFISFWPDGSRHTGRPTPQQMAEQPITGYKLSQLRVVPVGADAALVTYIADVKTPGDNAEHQMAVGEAWVKRNGQWLIRGYSGTLIK